MMIHPGPGVNFLPADNPTLAPSHDNRSRLVPIANEPVVPQDPPSVQRLMLAPSRRSHRSSSSGKMNADSAHRSTSKGGLEPLEKNHGSDHNHKKKKSRSSVRGSSSRSSKQGSDKGSRRASSRKSENVKDAAPPKDAPTDSLSSLSDSDDELFSTSKHFLQERIKTFQSNMKVLSPECHFLEERVRTFQSNIKTITSLLLVPPMVSVSHPPITEDTRNPTPPDLVGGGGVESRPSFVQARVSTFKSNMEVLTGYHKNSNSNVATDDGDHHLV